MAAAGRDRSSTPADADMWEEGKIEAAEISESSVFETFVVIHFEIAAALRRLRSSQIEGYTRI